MGKWGENTLYLSIGGGFKYFLFSPRTLGKWNPIVTVRIFFKWVETQPPISKKRHPIR